MIDLDIDCDGRAVHTFRQSTIKELDTCPERGRASLVGLMPKVLKDATCMGTAVHAGIEAATVALTMGHPMTPDDINNVAQAEFDGLVHAPGFVWVKYGEVAAHERIERACERFYDDIYAQLDPILVEHEFGPLVIHEDDHRVIQVKGTIDLLDGTYGPVDYKTTGDARAYKRGRGGEAWKLDRWAIQPTIYLYALWDGGYLSDVGPWEFMYLAFDFGSPEVELHSPVVRRQLADFVWAADKLVSYAMLIEAGVPVWPKQDNHALCSEKWCDWWSQCKGVSYADAEWPIKGT